MARRRAEQHVRLRAKRWTGSPTPYHLWLIFVEGQHEPVRLARTPATISIADAETAGLDARNALEFELSMDEFRNLDEGRHFYTYRFLESTVPATNPIEGMPGGSVSGCIKAQKAKPKGDRPRDAGAYCAAIADRIEPGWRQLGNPRERRLATRLARGTR